MVLRNIVNTNSGRQSRNEFNVKTMMNRRKWSNASFAPEQAIWQAIAGFAEENETFVQEIFAQGNVARAILYGDVAEVNDRRWHVVVGNVLRILDCRSLVVVVTMP